MLEQALVPGDAGTRHSDGGGGRSAEQLPPPCSPSHPQTSLPAAPREGWAEGRRRRRRPASPRLPLLSRRVSLQHFHARGLHRAAERGSAGLRRALFLPLCIPQPCASRAPPPPRPRFIPHGDSSGLGGRRKRPSLGRQSRGSSEEPGATSCHPPPASLPGHRGRIPARIPAASPAPRSRRRGVPAGGCSASPRAAGAKC